MNSIGNLLNLVSILPMAPCIPQNDLLTGAILPAFDLLAGGVGGVLVKILVVVMLLTLAAISIVKVLRQHDAGQDVQKFVWVGAVLPVVIIVIIVTTTVFNALNNLC